MPLVLVGHVAGPELDFQEVILDPSDIAYEHDVGGIGGGGG